MIGVGLDETTIHRHVLPLYQSGLHASGYDLFKQFLKQSGFLEASMAILGEGRVVWNLLIKSQSSEPAPRQVHAQFFHQPALTGHTVQIANPQTPQQQSRIKRRPACVAVKSLQLLAHEVEADVTIN